MKVRLLLRPERFSFRRKDLRRTTDWFNYSNALEVIQDFLPRHPKWSDPSPINKIVCPKSMLHTVFQCVVLLHWKSDASDGADRCQSSRVHVHRAC